MRWCIFPAILLLTTSINAAEVLSADDRVVFDAVLSAIFERNWGGDAIAFPQQRRPVAVADTTVVPRHTGLDLYSDRSPQKDVDAYRRLRGTRLFTTFRQRGRNRVSLRGYKPPKQFEIMRVRTTDCGPQGDPRTLTSAVALSRPGYSAGRTRALVYSEQPGGGAVYSLRKEHGRWIVVYDVVLWECG